MSEHRLYKKVCILLTDYNVMLARIRNIDLDLTRIPAMDTPEDAIEGLYFSKEQGGIPASGSISDRTSTVALKWSEEFFEVNRDISMHRRSLEFEKRCLAQVVKKLDNAMESLEPLQREIIKMFYVEKKNWPQITVALYDKSRSYYTERHCRRLRAAAITCMVKAMFGVKIKEPA